MQSERPGDSCNQNSGLHQSVPAWEAPFALPRDVSESDLLEASIVAERANRLARRTDPSTSHAAAMRAKAFAFTHADAITGALWRPMTPPEISKVTRLTVVQIDRRRKELIDAGLVRLTGRQRDGFEEWERVDSAFIGRPQ